ncbi:MAG: hypothetical protein E6J86_18475 [Deltaproteobacteria bacterium]|nr:MAG: hypothetical protein E6J86_18475 [Deltaproteobacteria bacterium]
MHSLNDQKQALRAQVRARAPKPGSPAFVDASVRAQERLSAVALQSGARVIALYRALPSECGTACVFVAGALGVEEPTGGPVSLHDIDLLVVPAIAVDTAGRRLGRGKGHYDATLAAYGGSSVALVFDSQLVLEVPVGEHDRRVGAVCTEARWVSVP